MKKFFSGLCGVLRVVAFLLCLFLALDGVYRVLHLKKEDNALAMEAFYAQPKNSIDLLVVGSSHAYESVSPAALWTGYGVTAYDLCASAQPIWNTYYYLKEGLKTQTPKVILLDVFKVVDIADEYAPLTDTYRSTMSLRSPIDRWRNVCVSTPDWGERLSCYTGWPVYHTRYTELTRDDLMNQIEGIDYIDWKGYVGNVNVFAEGPFPDVSAVGNATAPLPEKGEKYLRMCIELAQEKQIPIVLMVVPHAFMAQEYQPMYNTVAQLAQEYGVPFWNGNEHFADTGMTVEHVADVQHLNIHAAQPFADFLMRELLAQYSLPDHRGDPAYESWVRGVDATLYVQKW